MAVRSFYTGVTSIFRQLGQSCAGCGLAGARSAIRSLPASRTHNFSSAEMSQEWT